MITFNIFFLTSQPFKASIFLPIFQFSNIQSCINLPTFKHSNLPTFQLFNFLTFQPSNLPTFQPSNYINPAVTFPSKQRLPFNPRTLKALVYTQYGGPEELQLIDVPVPLPRDNEVLVKVYAASLNDWDLGLLKGDLANRVLNGMRRPKITILGSDVAGVVTSAGRNVTKFRVGDAVYGDLSGTWGGFAEFVCANENALAVKPQRMTFEHAAAIPQAGVLTTQGLLDIGGIKHGQALLINGGGGGVGTFAIQIARRYGVEVTGVDHLSKLDLMRSMGYDHVIDYQQEDFTRNGIRYDLILDTKSNRSAFAYAGALNPGGKYVTVGGDIPRLLGALALSPLISLLLRKKIAIVALKPNKDLALLSSLYEEGSLRPVIDGPYSLDDAVKVFNLFRDGLHKGKVVFSIATS